MAFNWKNPDYIAVFRERMDRLMRLRKDPVLLAQSKVYYKDHPADFINDWGVTVDPRVAAIPGRTPIMPFILFPKQRDWIEFTMDRWRANEPGLTDKSRDLGLSWLVMSLGVTLCIFWDDLSIGIGSAKEDKVDLSGDPSCLFYKGRMFLQYLPPEYRGGFILDKHSAHMRLRIPDTRSSFVGEAGDKIGRGARTSLYFLDEAAHLERPKLIDASLVATTDCRMDVSSVNGTANSFAERRHSGNIKVFTFHWRDDPRKDDAWAEKKKLEVNDPVVWAAEYEINYTASVEGVIIPQEWVQAAVDAHIKLGITPTGVRRGALDVADQGRDANAYACRHGILLEHCESWKGSGKIDGREWDMVDTVRRAFFMADHYQEDGFDYDADGLGAGVRGDARIVQDQRLKDKHRVLRVGQFRGSGAVMDPERSMIEGRKNEDFFENFKAQSWWALRFRFLAVFRAMQGLPYDPADIISIHSGIPERAKLLVELSQPTWKLSKTGKVMVEKMPDGTMSPNLADSVMIAFAPRRPPMKIDDNILEDLTHATGSSRRN